MSDAGERNQAATPMRLQQAQATGDIPKSAELAASLSMLGAIGAAYLTFSNISKWLQRSTTDSWSLNGANNYLTAYSPDAVVDQMQTLLFDLAGVLLPFMASIVLITIAANWIQTGPLWLPSKAVPDISNFGLGKWKQKFGLLNLFGIGGIGLPKIAIGLAVMLAGTWYQREALFSLANMPAEALVSRMFSIVALVSLQVAGTLAVLGVFDFGLQWMANRRRLQMSTQEIREELRSQGGEAVERVGRYRDS